jgi:hypothetical protein
MGWFLAIILVLFAMYGCNAPKVSKQNGKPDQCLRATCWDEPSGQYLSQDEWNKKRRMMEDSDR